MSRRPSKVGNDRRESEISTESEIIHSSSSNSTKAYPEPPTPHGQGIWGQNEAVNYQSALEDFESLREQLSRIETNKTGGAYSRRNSTPGRLARFRSSVPNDGVVTPPDSTDEKPSRAFGEEDFQLDRFMREGHFEKRENGESMKKVGVVYKNLTVRGVGTSTSYVKVLSDAVIGTFGPDFYRIMTGFFPALTIGKGPPTRELISGFTGAVRDGEMMLVLGKPGAGCSTFLRAVANQRASFAAVEGEVHYGGIPAAEAGKKYRGEVIYNEEDDQHFPVMTVYQTLEFALLNKTKKAEKENIPIIINALLKMFGISHAAHTIVGNAFIRGVSGGERKRVSIAETLATKSAVTCWDNSTRGLDANTALDYAKSLRIMTDVSNRTTIVTLYQAGEEIYNLMDKVTLIDQGRMIFSGPATEAKKYFTDLGFQCPERQTTADFLTSITDRIERQIRPGFEDKVPRTPDELAAAFRNSPNYARLLEDVSNYEQELSTTGNTTVTNFKKSVKSSKSRTVCPDSSHTVSFVQQVLACTRREYWLLRGDMQSFWTTIWTNIIITLLVGAQFWKQKDDTTGVFMKGGSAYFGCIFLGWIRMSEIVGAVLGRDIVQRHKTYALHRPSAVVVARLIVDIPITLIQVSIFTIILYFMAKFEADGGKFFIFFLLTYTNAFCITALYRMFSALCPTLDDAIRFSGMALNICIIYAGYIIPKTQLLHDSIWFGWLFHLNPMGYLFEAILANEFSGKTMRCAGSMIVPRGDGYDNFPQYQGCVIASGRPGNLDHVSGDEFIAAQYSYTRAHLWRNFGVVIAWTTLYIIVTIAATETISFVAPGSVILHFKKSKKSKKVIDANKAKDEEKANGGLAVTDWLNGDRSSDEVEKIIDSKSIFTFKEIEYTIPYNGGERKLLNKVSGYAKPGIMVALMGASGAGKTTLLNTLAQRHQVGVITGEIQMDGRPLGIEFQRGTGYCEQMDVHDPAQTVREAMEFSAILRQPASVPKAEKVEYVNKLMVLLELDFLQDAVVRSLGVEQKKRLTVGVELAARPDLLLFLDEPTSGLDSQSAFSIVRILKKLSQAGQAIICTIHQPSSILIQQFDMILALNPGGNTFYFGPVGENGADVIRYFGEKGAYCPPGKNVAEFVIETAAKGAKSDGTPIDWDHEWRTSKEAKAILSEIDRLRDERREKPLPEVELKEFAAPMWLQITMLTKRLFRQQWREPSYVYAKLWIGFMIGVFNGFTFWNPGNTIQDLQNRIFTAYFVVVFPPAIVNSVVPKFFENRMIWEARELPSRIYGWVPFCTAHAVAEIPSAVATTIIYYLLWYFPSGQPTDTATSGFVFFMMLLLFLFIASWGHWVAAPSPSPMVTMNILPFIFVVFGLFNGIIVPHRDMPDVFYYTLYYLSPCTYWLRGVLSATIPGIPVHCAPHELGIFEIPPSFPNTTTCATYAANFLSTATGYLTNPDARSECAYCPYSVADEYLRAMDIPIGGKWKYFGAFGAMTIMNWVLLYFFVYTCRIRGWTFGMVPLFKWIGFVINLPGWVVGKVMGK